MRKVRVLIVDSSHRMRKWLTSLLIADPQTEVVGVACDPFQARELIKHLNPDVVTSAIEMPRMNGVKFLENIMRIRPIPVVMIATKLENESPISRRVLELGAADIICLPETNLGGWLSEHAKIIRSKIKNAATQKLNNFTSSANSSLTVNKTEYHSSMERPSRFVIAIGASTGGTEALEKVLTGFPADSPGIVVALHISEPFSKALAERLDKVTKLRVVEASGKQQIMNGHVYIAPGDRHLIVTKWNDQYYCSLNEGPPVNQFRPSVDVLFNSVASSYESRSLGVILTGMGKDGALGMKKMNEVGATTVAQDEGSSLVFGMPKAAISLGVVDHVLPLDKISEKLLDICSHERVV